MSVESVNPRYQPESSRTQTSLVLVGTTLQVIYVGINQSTLRSETTPGIFRRRTETSNLQTQKIPSMAI